MYKVAYWSVTTGMIENTRFVYNMKGSVANTFTMFLPNSLVKKMNLQLNAMIIDTRQKLRFHTCRKCVG